MDKSHEHKRDGESGDKLPKIMMIEIMAYNSEHVKQICDQEEQEGIALLIQAEHEFLERAAEILPDAQRLQQVLYAEQQRNNQYDGVQLLSNLNDIIDELAATSTTNANMYQAERLRDMISCLLHILESKMLPYMVPSKNVLDNIALCTTLNAEEKQALCLLAEEQLRA